MRQGTNKRKKTERKKKENIGKPSQKSEQEATSVEKAKGRWMREKDRGRVHLPLIYSEFLLRGKKAGKQVIRSTGLSIVVGVDGT